MSCGVSSDSVASITEKEPSMDMTGSCFTFNSAQIKCTSFKTGEHSKLLLELSASNELTLSTVTLQSSGV